MPKWPPNWAAAAEFSARSAMKNQMSGFSAELAQTQGMLAFNHLERYRELEANLSKGCSTAVLEKLKISAATETMLLSSALKEHPGGWLAKDVATREPNLPAHLLQQFGDEYRLYMTRVRRWL